MQCGGAGVFGGYQGEEIWYNSLGGIELARRRAVDFRNGVRGVQARKRGVPPLTCNYHRTYQARRLRETIEDPAGPMEPE